jgi:heme/copper-type cytochrome/quinol oxidase subunit 4
MWFKERLVLTPQRAWEMAATCFTGIVIAVVIVIAVGSMVHARWKPEYAQ